MLKKTRGFTLIELIIVLAVLGVLAAIVVPNVAGYLEQGKDRAFKADEKLLQAAVDAWRTDKDNPGNQWPTVGGVKGAPDDANADEDFVDVGDTNSFIKISSLNTGNFIRGLDSVKSFNYDAGVTGATGATNDPVGSYYWYIDSSGTVTAWYDADDDKIMDAGETGYQDGVYP